MELGHGDNVIALNNRVLDHLLGMTQAADAGLDQVFHIGHWRDVPKGVAVSELKIMYERRVICVGIKMNHIDIFFYRPHNGISDRMVSTHHDEQVTSLPGLACHFGGVVKSLFDVGRPDINIAEVRDHLLGHLGFEILLSVFRIVVAFPALTEAKRMFAQGPRPHP